MLTEVARPDGTTVKFAYDALGRRVHKKVGEVETRWIWDGHVPVHELQTGAPDVTWYYEPESFAPLARFTDDTRLTAVTDHLGTPTALYDQDGKLAWDQQLDVYGVPRAADQPNDLCLHRWPGQYADPETGLHYNGLRYYDPELGQYLCPDPIRLDSGLELYGYGPDPLIWTDPYGLAKCPPGPVDLASPARRRHILYGDASGGGHRPGLGLPGKTEFPKGWSDDKIMHEISDVATDPAVPWVKQKGKIKKPPRYSAEGDREGVRVKVVLEPEGEGIVTGHPTNLPRNPP
jgi:RHS repeat-associated protein